MGLAVWTQDEAGPFQTVPFPGNRWREDGRPQRRPHEYVREGKAKLLTLFHPGSGAVRARGVRCCPNVVLHSWFKEELDAILAAMPSQPQLEGEANRAWWRSWQEELRWPITLPQEFAAAADVAGARQPGRAQDPEMVLWMFARGIMPLYTPLAGSWLNMCESVQRIIKRRALECQHPQTAEEIIGLLEATVRGWNQEPTPFDWGGRRAARRARSRERRHALGGSGACVDPLRRRQTTRSNGDKHVKRPTSTNERL